MVSTELLYGSRRYSDTAAQKAWQYLRQGKVGRLCSGVSLVLRARVYSAITPIMAQLVGRSAYSLRGSEYRYFIASFNSTWANERAVELSYAQELLRSVSGNEVLEVGNVLKNYLQGDWIVCDKYENAPGVINDDVLSFELERRFLRIISISTLEHVGFDEPDQNVNALPLAVKNLRNHLREGGELYVTLPLGYNPAVDQHLLGGSSGFDQVDYLVREGVTKWRQCAQEEAHQRQYGQPYPCANALAIGKAFA